MDEHITTGQAMIILITTRVAIAISTMPTVNLPPYNQDIWFMNLLSIVYTIIMYTPILFLSNRFSNFTVTGYMRIIYGKILGGIIVVLYGLFFIMNTVNGLTILTELTTSTVLLHERNMSIVIFIALVMFYFMTKGGVSSARGFQLLAPIAGTITIILVVLGLKNVDFTFLKPILRDSSFIDINQGAILLSLYFTEVFILLMMVPFLRDKKKINKISIISIIASMVALALIVVVTQGTLGIQQTRHSNAAFLLYVRLIDAFNQFERIDSIFITSWIISSIGRNVGFLYISTKAFRELFNKKEDDRIILSLVTLAVVIISLSIINNRSVIGIRKHFDGFYSILFIIFVLVIPIITCIVYFFRKKKLRVEEPSKELTDNHK